MLPKKFPHSRRPDERDFREMFSEPEPRKCGTTKNCCYTVLANIVAIAYRLWLTVISKAGTVLKGKVLTETLYSSWVLPGAHEASVPKGSSWAPGFTYLWILRDSGPINCSKGQ